jgi:hypothetical protein
VRQVDFLARLYSSLAETFDADLAAALLLQAAAELWASPSGVTAMLETDRPGKPIPTVNPFREG